MQQIAILCLSLLFAGRKPILVDVRFERGLSWEQVKEKARMENKYIFVDCFTTWCVPCRNMDLKVYTDKVVADYLNEKFVSVKVQLDTTKADNEDIQNWYAEAHAMMSKYKVGVFPTFLFLSPDGKLVHKAAGFYDSKNFVELLQKALDPDQQAYTLLDAFHRQALAYSKMPELIRSLERIQEKKAAMGIADFYMENYLLKAQDEELYTKKNIRFIASHIQDSKSKAFGWYFEHTEKIDSVEEKGFAEKVLDHTISQEEIIPVLNRWDSLKIETIGTKDWTSPYKVISSKYGVEYADRTILNGQIRWYSHKRQWKEVVKFDIKKVERYGLDTAGEINLSQTNNMIYNVIFQYSTDKKALHKAIEWMKIICDANPREQDYLDTYANLLYKAGRRKEALVLEEKAVSMNSRKDKGITESFEKMKKGQPTWESK